jgi:hypothetical protein
VNGWVNFKGVWISQFHVAMVRPGNQAGFTAVVFSNGGHELVAGTVAEVLAVLNNESVTT